MSTAQEIFDRFSWSILTIDSSIRFWQGFLHRSVENYKASDYKPDFYLSSIFSAYDIDLAGAPGFLKTAKKTFQIDKGNIDQILNEYFNSIKCLHLVRVYNEVELVLIRCIQSNFFPNLDDPILSRKAYSKIETEVKAELKRQNLQPNSANNRHLFDLLKIKSTSFNQYCAMKISFAHPNVNTESFFIFLSIIRNVITHAGLAISTDTENNIKSVAKELYDHYCETVRLPNGENILYFKEGDYYMQVIHLLKTYVTNCIKFIFNLPDLTHLNMHGY